jgi:hypothetical protein
MRAQRPVLGPTHGLQEGVAAAYGNEGEAQRQTQLIPHLARQFPVLGSFLVDRRRSALNPHDRQPRAIVALPVIRRPVADGATQNRNGVIEVEHSGRGIR